MPKEPKEPTDNLSISQLEQLAAGFDDGEHNCTTPDASVIAGQAAFDWTSEDTAPATPSALRLQREERARRPFWFAALALLSGGCSTQVSGVELHCQARVCATPETLAVTVEAFAQQDPFHDFNLDSAPIAIHWLAEDAIVGERPSDTEVQDSGVVVGLTDASGQWIVTTSHAALVHELAHLHLYRQFGDGEASHTRRWTAEVTSAVEAAEDADRLARCGTLARDRDPVTGRMLCAR